MIIDDITADFARLAERIEREKGPLVLFALFLREDAPNRWDLILSAPWAQADQKAATNFLVEQIKRDMAPENLVGLSRIVLIDPDNDAVEALNRAFSVETGGSVDLQDVNLFGLPIKRARILASKRLAA